MVDDRSLWGLVEESRDLHSDAMKVAAASLPDFREVGAARGARPVDAEEAERFDARRRSVLRSLGLSGAGLARRSLAYGSLGSVFTSLMAAPARADEALDIQILQTASSLERLAVDTYNTALTTNLGRIAGLPGSAGQVLRTFMSTTMMQHEEHKKAFQAQTTALGGVVQDNPNPKFRPLLDAQVPRLQQPVDVVDFAATLEKIATDTYLVNLTLLEDTDSKEVVASVMGVEAQHLATLRAVGALLRAGSADLVKIPLGSDLARVPRTVGSVAFPDALEKVNPDALIAQPATGKVE